MNGEEEEEEEVPEHMGVQLEHERSGGVGACMNGWVSSCLSGFGVVLLEWVGSE